MHHTVPSVGDWKLKVIPLQRHKEMNLKGNGLS